MLDEYVQLAAILAGDGHVRGRLIDFIVDACLDAVTKRDHIGPGDDFIGERVLADFAEQDARRARVIDAELCFEPGTRRGLAGKLEYQRMYLEVDALDVVDGQAVRAAKL